MLFKKEIYRGGLNNFDMILYRKGEYQIRKMISDRLYLSIFITGHRSIGKSLLIHGYSNDDFTITYDSGGKQQGRELVYTEYICTDSTYYLNSRRKIFSSS